MSDGYESCVEKKCVLDEAKDIVNGARREEYGDPKLCFSRIARLWSGYLDIPITSLDVAHMMMMLKISRGYNGYQRDCAMDIAGYAYCAEIISAE